MSFEFLAVFFLFIVYFVVVCTLSVPQYLLSLLFIWTVLSEINDLIDLIYLRSDYLENRAAIRSTA